jgi:hypothetical protein
VVIGPPKRGQDATERLVDIVTWYVDPHVRVAIRPLSLEVELMDLRERPLQKGPVDGESW